MAFRGQLVRQTLNFMLCLGTLRTTEFVLLYLRGEPAFHLSQLIQKPRVAVPQLLFPLLRFAA